MLNIEAAARLKRELHSFGDSFVAYSWGIKVFATGSCEFCGGKVQEVNPVKITNVTPEVALELGLIELDSEPSEIWWDDDFGGSVCEICDGDPEGGEDG